MKARVDCKPQGVPYRCSIPWPCEPHNSAALELIVTLVLLVRVEQVFVRLDDSVHQALENPNKHLRVSLCLRLVVSVERSAFQGNLLHMQTHHGATPVLLGVPALTSVQQILTFARLVHTGSQFLATALAQLSRALHVVQELGLHGVALQTFHHVSHVHRDVSVVLVVAICLKQHRVQKVMFAVRAQLLRTRLMCGAPPDFIVVLRRP